MSVDLELTTPRWQWEKTDPNRAGAAGDLAKLFRNEPVREPGALAENAPPRDATVLAREVIQNAWDAALELRDSADAASSRGCLPPLGLGQESFYPPPPESEPPEFEIRFRYRSAVGTEKTELFSRLGLRELAARADRVGDRRALGLQSRLCFDDHDSGSPLTSLLIDETGTTGMYGPWKGAQSKLYLALLAIGYTPKAEGQGGSYGYGKAGLIAGSRIRTVIAYTCFRERTNDPGVTRRLLGMTYWGQHSLGGEDFTGFARFGRRAGDGHVRPFENDKADAAATLFGFDLRSADHANQWGTSLLLVEPAVAPLDLERAISRSWWPALEEGRFHAVIETASGQEIDPRPQGDPVLAPFLEAYEIASPTGLPGPNGRRKVLHHTPGKPGQAGTHQGVLGMVADPADWSFVQSRGDIEHRSLIALVRRPRMVVEYFEAGRSAPYIRGAFVADDSVNELLRLTEPKGHDAWRTTPDNQQDRPDAFELARSIKRRIGSHVASFRKELKPPPKPPEKYQLKLFDRAMRQLLGGRVGPGGRPAGPRPFTIRLEPVERREDGDGALTVAGKAQVGLSEHFKGDSARVVVTIRFPLIEDQKAGDAVDLRVDSPDDFDRRENGPAATLRGVLHRGEEAVFRFRTAPFRADWTGRIEVSVAPIAQDPQEAAP